MSESSTNFPELRNHRGKDLVAMVVFPINIDLVNSVILSIDWWLINACAVMRRQGF